MEGFSIMYRPSKTNLKVVELQKETAYDKLKRILEENKEELQKTDSDDLLVLSINKAKGELFLVSDPEDMPVRSVCSFLLDAYQQIFAATIIKAVNDGSL